MEADGEYLYLVLAICAGLSLAGSLFVIGTYLFSAGLDALINRQIFFLAISDSIMSVGFLLTPWTYNLDENSEAPICLAQAILLSFSRKTSIFTAFIIFYSIYLLITKINPILTSNLSSEEFADKVEDAKENLTKRVFLLLGGGFLISAVITPLPLITSDYGHLEQGWCFLKMDGSDLDTFWMVLQFQGIFLFFILSCVYFYYKINQEIKSSSDNCNQVELYQGVRSKLRWYPLIIIICYFPIFSNRIIQQLNIFDYNTQLARCIVGAVCGLTGFFNMIIFAIQGGILDGLCTDKEENSQPLLSKE